MNRILIVAHVGVPDARPDQGLHHRHPDDAGADRRRRSAFRSSPRSASTARTTRSPSSTGPGVLFAPLAQAADEHNAEGGLRRRRRPGRTSCRADVDLGGRSVDDVKVRAVRARARPRSCSRSSRFPPRSSIWTRPTDADQLLHGDAVVHAAAAAGCETTLDRGDHRAAVRQRRRRSGAGREADAARRRSRRSAWSSARPTARSAKAKKVDELRDVRAAVRADVPAVHRGHDERAAAAQRRHRREDEPDQRGAGRVGDAVPADDGQAARHRSPCRSLLALVYFMGGGIYALFATGRRDLLQPALIWLVPAVPRLRRR